MTRAIIKPKSQCVSMMEFEIKNGLRSDYGVTYDFGIPDVVFDSIVDVIEVVTPLRLVSCMTPNNRVFHIPVSFIESVYEVR